MSSLPVPLIERVEDLESLIDLAPEISSTKEEQDDYSLRIR